MPSFRSTLSIIAAAFTLNACASASEPQRAASPVQEVPTQAATMTEERAVAERAESHFQAGRFDEAIPLFRHAIELRPDSSRLYNRVAESYVALGLFDEAELWTRRARANTPEAPWPGFWHCIFGWLAALEGERASLALHTDSLLMAASVEAPLSWSCAASNEIYLGEYADARTHIERFRTEAPDSHAPLAHYGFALLQTGEEERAAELLRDYEARRRAEIAEDPGKWDAHYTLAEIEAIRGNQDAAVGHLSEAVRQGAGDQFWFYYTVSDETWGDPIWESVRGHRGFEQLMAELKAEVERMRERVVASMPPEERVDVLMAEYDRDDAPGAVVGVIRDGEPIFAKGYGVADLTHKVPITTETRFNIGSVSKQFTAFALTLLQQEGKLSLDNPVRMYLPELPKFKEEVTLRHLLTHTSGLRETYGMAALAGRIPGQDLLRREGALEVVQRQPELEFSPGSEFQYNSSAYVLLSEIVERVTGEPFPEWMQENVFGPLGMENTVIEREVEQVIPGAADSYMNAEGGGYRTAFSNRAYYGTADV